VPAALNLECLGAGAGHVGADVAGDVHELAGLKLLSKLNKHNATAYLHTSFSQCYSYSVTIITMPQGNNNFNTTGQTMPQRNQHSTTMPQRNRYHVQPSSQCDKATIFTIPQRTYYLTYIII